MVARIFQLVAVMGITFLIVGCGGTDTYVSQAILKGEDVHFQGQHRSSPEVLSIVSQPKVSIGTEELKDKEGSAFLQSFEIDPSSTVTLMEGIPLGKPYIYVFLHLKVKAKTAAGEVRVDHEVFTSAPMIKSSNTNWRVGWSQNLFSQGNDDYTFQVTDKKVLQKLADDLKILYLDVAINSIAKAAASGDPEIARLSPKRFRLNNFKLESPLQVVGQGNSFQLFLPSISFDLVAK